MDKYLIKKGNHYASISLFQRLFSFSWNIKQIAVDFCFKPECWWAPARNEDDNDLNKLVGIGYGLDHHKNSARLAWKPDFDQPGMIKIFGYIYDENTSGHISQYITSVKTGLNHNGLIKSLPGKYMFMVDSVSVYMDNIHSDSGLGFRLFPYFGGNNTAPCDMVISMEII